MRKFAIICLVAALHGCASFEKKTTIDQDLCSKFSESSAHFTNKSLELIPDSHGVIARETRCKSYYPVNFSKIDLNNSKFKEVLNEMSKSSTGKKYPILILMSGYYDHDAGTLFAESVRLSDEK